MKKLRRKREEMSEKLIDLSDLDIGTKIEEERGEGKLMQVKVKVLRIVPPDEPDEQGGVIKRKE